MFITGKIEFQTTAKNCSLLQERSISYCAFSAASYYPPGVKLSLQPRNIRNIYVHHVKGKQFVLDKAEKFCVIVRYPPKSSENLRFSDHLLRSTQTLETQSLLSLHTGYFSRIFNIV